jgi:UDP-glucose 4-epimerase
MKAMILGGNGYIGKHLVFYLHNLGWDLVVYDIQDEFTGDLNVSYFQFDISKKNALENIDFNCSYLFYFIGLTGTDISFEKFDDFINVNEIGLLSVLTEIKKKDKTPKIIFPSTRLVYKGNKGIGLAEDAVKDFKTIYASSKYNGELYLEMYKEIFNLNYTIFRICVPYGNLFSRGSYGTVSFFLDKAINKQPIVLYGDGSLKRTFTHILDICHQIVEVCQKPESDGECFNIEGETFSLDNIAHYFGKKYGVQVKYIDWPDKALRLESGDTIFNSDKIKELLKMPLKFNMKEWINL